MSDVDLDLVSMMRAVVGQEDPVVKATRGQQGLDHALWAQLAELGLTLLTSPETTGGSGASWAEAAALHAEAAAAATHVPLGETDLLAGPLLREAGYDVDGSPVTVVCLDDRGTARAAPWLDEVRLIVAVRVSSAGEREASALSPEDVELAPVRRAAGPARFDVVAAPQALSAGRLDVPTASVDALWLRGALLRSVQSAGAMERVLTLCLEHVATRHQFGRALARFQTVQNLVSDIAAEVALSRAAVDAAVAAVDRSDGRADDPDASFAVAVARSCTTHATSIVVRAAHQLHGAMGTTLEHPLHLFTEPLLDWRADFGSGDHWDRRITARVLEQGAVWPLVAPVR